MVPIEWALCHREPVRPFGKTFREIGGPFILVGVWEQRELRNAAQWERLKLDFNDDCSGN